ncbi:LPXTG cell wall anchor domain-containing protein, partial [Vibrio cholerae]
MSTEQSFFIDSINKLWNNKDWIFSGIGVFLLSSLFVFFKRRKMHDIQSSPSQTIINFSNTNENYQKIEKSPENENKNSHNKTEEYYK